MFSTPAVPCGIVQPIENLYPSTTPSLSNPLLYNAVQQQQQQQRPVPQHLLFSPQLVHMKSAYYNTTAATTVVKEEDESEKDRRLLIDFLLNQQDSRSASSRNNNNTTRQPPTYPGEGDEDYQDVPSVTNLAPPPFNLFSSPHNSCNSCNDLPCYSSISNHNNHCNNNYGTKHDLVLPTFNGKKTRRRLTHEELYLLESVYTHNQTPDSFTKIELSKMLCMSPQQVSNWFQNRRSKNRKALQYRNAKRLKMEQKLKSQPQLQLQQH